MRNIPQYIEKEANRFYWIVKGHLIPDEWSDKDVSGVYDSYLKRIWGNHENIVHEEGFEEAWRDKNVTLQNNETKK